MKSNNVIRKQLFPDEEDIVCVGDVLMGYRTISNEKQTVNIIENSMDYRVVGKSDAFTNSYGIEGYLVNLREDLAFGKYKFQDVFIVNTNDHENLHRYAELHDFFRDMGKANKREWKKYYAFRRSNVLMKVIEKHKNGLYRDKEDIIAKDMDYGYTITSHKSQGSTYSHVFVLEEDINDNWVIEERNQIKYVALTRPSISATILTTKMDY
jgi:exodeoxyribonuclease-5